MPHLLFLGLPRTGSRCAGTSDRGVDGGRRVRGEKAPRLWTAAFVRSLRQHLGLARPRTVGAALLGGHLLRTDGTADCDACEMPLFPVAIEDGVVRLECANRHRGQAPIPRDPAVRRAVEAWVARKGAQLHVQHERWGTDDEEGRDEETI